MTPLLIYVAGPYRGSTTWRPTMSADALRVISASRYRALRAEHPPLICGIAPVAV